MPNSGSHGGITRTCFGQRCHETKLMVAAAGHSDSPCGPHPAKQMARSGHFGTPYCTSKQMILCYTCGGKAIGQPSLPFRPQLLMALRPATGHPTLVLGAMLGASTVCRSAISLPLTILCCSETFSEGEILNSEVTSWGIKLHLIGRSGCST